jgi:hypothetical protein
MIAPAATPIIYEAIQGYAWVRSSTESVLYEGNQPGAPADTLPNGISGDDQLAEREDDDRTSGRSEVTGS